MPESLSSQLLPWKVAFRVEFRSAKFGLKFHPNENPDTGNGYYGVSLLDVPPVKDPNDLTPAQEYNSMLRPNQKHLALRKGLILTHINDEHTVNIPCEKVIGRLKSVPRPVKLRFVDTSAGCATHAEVEESNRAKKLAEIEQLVSKQSLKDVSPPSAAESELRSGSPTAAFDRPQSPLCPPPYPPTHLAKPNSHQNSPSYGSVVHPIAPPSTSTLKPSSSKPPSSQMTPSTVPGNTAANVPKFMNQREDVYKIVLLGSAGVGKSSILSVGIDGNDAYVERRPATLEPEFGSLYVPNPDISNPNKVIKVRIWDTAGQERYRAVTRSHYRRADGAILVYDVTDPLSFEALDGWLRDLREVAGDSVKSIVLVENKVDVLPEPVNGEFNRPKSFVNEHRVAEYCKANGLLFSRTSAKMNTAAYKWEGQKISDVIQQLVLNVHAVGLERGRISPADDDGSAETVALQPSSKASKKKNSECSNCN